MSFIITNDNNEYINISYMNNTFKLWYREHLWQKFTDLYYEKMITLEKLFKLSNSVDLYNHINKNDNLEFTNKNIFSDIKEIIKNNLKEQLTGCIDKCDQIEQLGMAHLTKHSKNINFPSYTPETQLEETVNYTPVDMEKNKSDFDFSTYLLNNAVNTNVQNYLSNKIKIQMPSRYGDILPYNDTYQVVNKLNINDTANINDTLQNEVYKLNSSVNYIDNSFMYHMPNDEQYEADVEINKYFISEVEKQKNDETKETNETKEIEDHTLLSDEVKSQNSSESAQVDIDELKDTLDSNENIEFTDYMLLSDNLNNESNIETGINDEEAKNEPLLKLSIYDTQCYK